MLIFETNCMGVFVKCQELNDPFGYVRTTSMWKINFHPVKEIVRIPDLIQV